MSALLLMTLVTVTPVKLDEVRTQSRANVAALQAELDRQRAEAQVTSARSGLLPQLNLSLSVGGNYVGAKNSIQPIVDPASGQVTGFEPAVTKPYSAGNFDLSLSLNQLIYDGRVWAQLAQAGSTREAAAGQEEEQRLASEFEGVRRFYNLYRAQKTLEVLEDRIRDDQTQVERADALFEAGRGRKDDVLAAQVNLGNDRIAAIQQQSAIATARADLATWLARGGGEELDAQDPGTLGEQLPEAPAFDPVVSEARQRRPLYRALEAQLRAAGHAVSASRAGYLPRVSASGFYDRNANELKSFVTSPALQNNLGGQLVLNWNLFSGLQTQAAVSDAEYAARKAQLNLEQTERELEGDLKKALENLRVQIAATQIARANREVARNGLHLSEERFAAGAATTLEVRDAQLKVTNAELSLLGNRIDVEIAREYLARAEGVRAGSTP